MKIVFLILASRTVVNEDDFRMQQQTWGAANTEDITVLWVRGSETEDFSLDSRQLYVPVSEKYENILEKTLLATKWIVETYNPDFIVRTNVSTYFDLAKMQKFLARMQRHRVDLMGYPEVTGRDYYFIKEHFRFMSGAGIVMSRKAAKMMLSLDSKSYTGIPDDVSISHFFSTYEINKHYITRSNLGYTRIYIPHWYTRLKSSENPSLTQDRFRLIDNHYSNRDVVSYLQIQWNEFRNFRLHEIAGIARLNVLAIRRVFFIRGQLWRK